MHRRDPGVARDLLPAASLSELIGDPFGRWMCSNSEPQKLPPAMTHDQQAIEQPKRDCRHHEQVHRGNPISMVTKERIRRDIYPPRSIDPHSRPTDLSAFTLAKRIRRTVDRLDPQGMPRSDRGVRRTPSAPRAAVVLGLL